MQREPIRLTDEWVVVADVVTRGGDSGCCRVSVRRNAGDSRDRTWVSRGERGRRQDGEKGRIRQLRYGHLTANVEAVDCTAERRRPSSGRQSEPMGGLLERGACG